MSDKLPEEKFKQATKPIRTLVLEWTRKAQSGTCTDDERNVYYECAEKLHDAVFNLEEEFRDESETNST